MGGVSGGGPLSQVERSIVLSSLADGRIPVTIDSDCGLPAVVEAGRLRVLDNGVVLVADPSPDVAAFAGEDVTVRFVWNGVPVSFVAQVRSVRAGIAFVAPPVMTRGEPSAPPPGEDRGGISARLFLELEEESGGVRFVNKHSVPCAVREPFRADFGGLPADALACAGELLRGAGEDSPRVRAACRALAEGIPGGSPVLLSVGVSHVVVGSADPARLPLSEGDERAIEVSFPLPRPLKARVVPLSFSVEMVLRLGRSLCAVCRVTSARMEDLRFLSDLPS